MTKQDKMTFPEQNSKPDLWNLQQDIMKFWKEHKTFEKSVEQRPADNPYRFYDGPPFITGLPHYGHMASSVAKDIVPRFWTMKGKRVERVWGWDCHGIPIEEKVQKKLNLETSADVEAIGLEKFTEECYNYTRSTSEEWERYVDNFGRWVDFKNSYKTMDNSYMETVWWVFKTMYDKNMMYEGKRVSMFSTKLQTPISNHEVAMDNSYDDINDPAITVKFKLLEDSSDSDEISLPDGYELRVARPEDAEEITLVRNECWFETYLHEESNITKEVLQQYRGDKTQKNIDQLHGWLTNGDIMHVVVYQGKIVGLKYRPYQDKKSGKWRIGGIYIKAAHHKKGLGAALMKTSLKNHRDKELWLTIADYNENAQKFYEKLGFKVSEEEAPSITFDNGAVLNETWMLRKSTQLQGEGNTYALARTTTPWTIPTNLALGVHKDIDYAKVSHDGDLYILARARVEDTFKDKDYEIVDEFQGDVLIGLAYKPPFDYYYNKGNEKDHHIVFADFATDESGTGIVHQAPEFGEDDFNLGKKECLTMTEAMNDFGRYTDQIADMEGTFYRDANPVVIEKLKEMGLLFHKASITHRVAHCPRSGVPLVYKAQDSWFVDIQSIKPKLYEAAEDINWYPGHFKYGRFAKNMEAAPDWGISRTRYWGTPMPVYRPKDDEGMYTKDETFVVGSRDELFEANKSFKQLAKVVLVRHGHTDYNDEHKGDDYSADASRLTDKGRHQAQAVANALAGTHIDAVYSSPQHRCLETLEPLLENKSMEAMTDKRLREIDMPANNGAPFSWDNWTWSDDPVDGKDGESVTQVYERVKSFLDDTIKNHAGETIVICAHGEPLKLIKKVFEDYDYDKDRDTKSIHNQKEDDLPMEIDYVFVDETKKLDLHRPYIDKVRVKSPTSGKELYRLEEVLDVWFDSGSMPYAQVHYPFENKTKMENSFPADFIVEYTGQIRAWFYLTHVIGVSLFDKPAFTNVICHGVVAGNDGRKMSKSLGNFPDPKPAFEQYGGDAIRMSIVSSPLFHAGDTSITEESFLEALKKYILPLWNTFYFFTTYANIDGFTLDKANHTKDNILDQWIMSELHTLIADVDCLLENYDLQQSSRLLGDFLDNLTNRYIRRSRRRFWKSESDSDKIQAYTTLYHVLVTFSQVAAPFMPFISEYIHKALTVEESVHLAYFPKSDKSLINEELSASMKKAQDVIRIGLSWRARNNVRVRQPLASITVGVELDEYFKAIVADELNVKEVILDPSINDTVTKICKPNGRLIGPKFGKDVKMIIAEAKNGNFEEHDGGSITVGHFKLEADEYEISYVKNDASLDIEVENGIVVSVDGTITPELAVEGYTRDLVRQIQEARKEAGYNIADRVEISLDGGSLVNDIKQSFANYIQEETLSTIVDSLTNEDLAKEIELGDDTVKFAIKR